MKPLSGIMPLVTSPPPVKPGTWNEGLLCSESSGQKLFAVVGGTISLKYGAITTWGSVFLELDSKTLPCSIRMYCQATDLHPEVA